MIDGYRLIDITDFLSDDEINTYLHHVKNFSVDLDNIESSLGFLCMGSNIIKALLIEDQSRYHRMKEKDKINYDDFKFLKHLNEKYDLPIEEYFNFFLHIANSEYNRSVLFNLIKKAYVKFLESTFDKILKPEYFDEMLGGINVYPKGSFIKKHVDTGANSERLLTTLFFLNCDRKKEDGSILKIYTKDEIIEIIPDCMKFIVLEHQNFNYVHEVTKNESDNVRYTVYCPFTIDDLNTKMI